MHRALASLFAFAAATSGVWGQDLHLPPLLSDHAVFQRGRPLRLWGAAAPGAEVRASASWGHEASSLAGDDGAFELRLQPPSEAGPHSVTLRCGSAQTKLDDVWFGEVWVCGGQSNMEWTLGPGVGSGIQDWQNEVAQADHPQIRVFDVPNVTSAEPRESCDGAWRVCSPATAGSFSAVGYLFGRDLQRELGVPVGLIVSCWGGTPCEAWTPEASLEGLTAFADGLAAVRAARKPPSGDSLASEQASWFAKMARKDPGENAGWTSVAFDDGAWPNAKLPGRWSGELARFDGVVWYRRQVEVPADWAGTDLVLSLGPIDDLDTVWVGGQRVGGMEAGEPWSTPRRYTIPGKVVAGGKTAIVLRVVDTGGHGGLTGQPSEMWLGREGDDAARVALAGDWRMHEGARMQALGAWPRASGIGPHTPTVLYNAMIAPLSRTAVRGAVFYQGESNVGAPLLYRRLFPAMIDAWRATFEQADMPFYYVQIAPFDYGQRNELAGFLREAQALTMTARANVGMAVTMDVGNPKNIHPLDKQSVGERLARWALAKTYGKAEIDPQGPTLVGHVVHGDRVHLEFAHARGLTTKDGKEPMNFMVAGEDREFHPATATVERETIVVHSPAVANPVAVRYAFGGPDAGNVVNGAGLPASSFRTDDWPPR
ncbi:MAG: sialate O-acetylesterase [Planctomycetota bacterium]